MKGIEWKDIADDILGKCIKQLIKDGLPINKKNLKAALECFYDIKVVEKE